MGGATERERAFSPASSLRTGVRLRTADPPTCPACAGKRHCLSSDEEIDYSTKPEFYDPELDDRDELWITKRRKGHYSDAVLSCPACFTILCYESQRHETYVTQYRAVFVANCKINDKQVLPQESRKQKKRRRASQSSTIEGNSQSSESVFRQVCCDVCTTEVGVVDEDEVYHFYDVIPSET